MNYSKIIVVCTGNTCRSPMAEGLLKHYLPDEIQVISRGLMVFQRDEANPFAVRTMKEKGIDISKHRSHPFNDEEINSKTLILTMTKRHKSVILQYGIKGHLYTIKEFIGQTGDVEDPYGGTMDVYRACANELEEIVVEIGGKVQ